MSHLSGWKRALNRMTRTLAAGRGPDRAAGHGRWPLLRGLTLPAIEGLEGRLLLSGDTTPPTAMLPAAQQNAVVGQTTYSFTVFYTDDTAIDVTTLGNTNLDVVGPVNAFTQEPTLVSFSNTAPNSVLATYQFTAPGGSFAAADGGDYSVFALAYSPSPSAQGVADTSGNGLAAAKIGDLNIAVQSPPSAQLTSNQAPFAVGSGPYTFTVNYSAAAAIDVSTFGNMNLQVTGPNGYSQLASFLPAQQVANGANVQRSTRLHPPTMYSPPPTLAPIL